MATILSRTALLEADKRSKFEGQTLFRPCDFAIVNTTLGSMVEPFDLFANRMNDIDIKNYDATEELRMVTDIQYINLDRLNLILGENVHGGYLMPRDGR